MPLTTEAHNVKPLINYLNPLVSHSLSVVYIWMSSKADGR